jgi:hypothetical protein
MTVTRPPGGASRGERRGDRGVEANARLTAAAAVILLVLLAAEGVTVLRIGQLLTPHVFIGMLLAPPIVVKIGSTSWRFAKYYRGDRAYRRKGPPPVVLRVLGPFVVVLTVTLFASGIVVLLGPSSLQQRALLVHKASFILWLGATAIHVLGHIRETVELAPADWLRRSRARIGGAGTRHLVLGASLVVGVLLALATVGQVSHYHRPVHHHDGIGPPSASSPP